MDFSGFPSGIRDPEALLQGLGPWVFTGLGLIVPIESGVLFPFLPNDSLLVTAAVLRTELDTHAWQILAIGLVAAVVGDQISYSLSHSSGRQLSRDSARVLRADHPKAAERFFAEYEPLSLVLGRLVSIVHTYIPLAAGTANMICGRFINWNVTGAIGWVASMVAVGALLGNIPGITSSTDKIMLLVIATPVLPVVVGGVNACHKAAVAKRLLWDSAVGLSSKKCVWFSVLSLVGTGKSGGYKHQDLIPTRLVLSPPEWHPHVLIGS